MERTAWCIISVFGCSSLSRNLQLFKMPILDNFLPEKGIIFVQSPINEEITWWHRKLKYTNGIAKELISYCGLYCAACPTYTSGKCEGCRGDSPRCSVGYASCKVKPCCVEHGYFSCADCEAQPIPNYQTKSTGKLIPMNIRIDRIDLPGDVMRVLVFKKGLK